MIDITPESKSEDTKRRVNLFQEGYKKLMEETKISVRPQISPDGPILNIVDLKYENNQSTK